jgi:prepilin-type N-terminal cleavage/methylation domain-containing protein
MTPRTRRAGPQRGFTLIELLLASAVFIIGLSGLTYLVVYSAKMRGLASKKAFAARFAADQLNEVTAIGYDGLVAWTPPTANTAVDWLGRTYLLTERKVTDCNAVTITNDNGTPDNATFHGSPLPTGTQTCCPTTNNTCCLFVEVDVNWRSENADGGTVTASGFVTKGCP